MKAINIFHLVSGSDYLQTPARNYACVRERAMADLCVERRKGQPANPAVGLRTLPLAALAILLGIMSANGQATWTPIGPAPITVTTSPHLVNYAGAIEAILVDPSNPNRVFIGSVNGGIWRTTNALGSNPTWVPLTDHMPSLSIADIKFSPLDSSHNTLFAGIGSVTAYSLSGPSAGLLKSADGGNTWTELARAQLGFLDIRNVIPTQIIDPGTTQQVVLVAAWGGGGLWRSEDGGTNFHLISGGASGLPARANFPAGYVTHLVADPGNPMRFYAGLASGVYQSDNGGISWTNINSNLPAGVFNCGTNGCVNRIELSVCPAGSRPVYAALLCQDCPGSGWGGCVSAKDIYRWNGAGWTPMGLRTNPNNNICFGGQCAKRTFSMLAHLTDPNVVFISGDFAPDSKPMVLRGSIGRWDRVTDPSLDNPPPHVDSRDMAYDGNGNILQSDDGGIWRLVNPDGITPQTWYWEAINGNLQVTEVAMVAYDTLNKVAVASSQDNDISQQTSSNSSIWEVAEWVGDGGPIAVDNSASDTTVRYYSRDLTSLLRRDYTAANGITTDRHPNLADPSTPTDVNSGLKNGTACWFVLNRVRPSRMLFFGQGLYEGVVDPNGNGDHGDSITNLTLAGQIGDPSGRSLGRGAVYGVANNPELVYVTLWVTNGGWGLYQRTNAGGRFQKVAAWPGIDGAWEIAADPYDWRRVYTVDSGNHIHRTTDGGATWTDITGNLPALGVTDLASVVLFSGADFPSETVLVSGFGGVFQTRNPSAGTNTIWSVFGPNMPNAHVRHLVYYPRTIRANGLAGDVLVAGVAGRGVWAVFRASQFVFPELCFVNAPTRDVPTPYPTVTAAHAAAEDCNVIRIAAGVYHEGLLTLYKRVQLESRGGLVTIRP